MSGIVEFPLESGEGALLVEVARFDSRPVTRRLSNGDLSQKASKTFEEAIDRVKPAAVALISRLKDLTDSPDEISVEFGLSMSAEAGAFIASASSSANFTVSLIWRKPS